MASGKYYWKNIDMANVVDSTNALTIQNGADTIYKNVPGTQYNTSLNAYETYTSHETNPPIYHNNVSIFRNIKVKSDTITSTTTQNIPSWCNAIKIYVQIKNGADGTDATLSAVNNNSLNYHGTPTNHNTNDNFNHENRNRGRINHAFNHHRHNNNRNNYTVVNTNYSSYTNYGGSGSTGRKIEINKAISIAQTQNIKIYISEASGISHCRVYISPKTDAANPPSSSTSRIILQSAKGTNATSPQTQNSNTTVDQTPWADHNNNARWDDDDDRRSWNVVQWDEAREAISDFHNNINADQSWVHAGNVLNGGYNHATFKGLANIDANHRNVTIVNNSTGKTASSGTLSQTLFNVGSGSQITTTDTTITSNEVQIFYFLI